MPKSVKSQPKHNKHLPKIDKRRAVGVMYRPVCKLLVLIGVAAILLSIATIWQYQSQKQRTKTTMATVTKISRINAIGSSSDDQKCNISYKFRLHDIDYISFTNFSNGNPTTDKCSLQVGSKIRVNYQPDRPANNAYKNDDAKSGHVTFGQTVGSVASIMIVGVIPLFLGIAGLYVARKETASKSNN